MRAMDDRFAAESDRARARPPLDAPSLDKATAAGFRVSGVSGGSGGASPTDSCTIWKARAFASRGRFFLKLGVLAREGIAHCRTAGGERGEPSI